MLAPPRTSGETGVTGQGGWRALGSSVRQGCGELNSTRVVQPHKYAPLSARVSSSCPSSLVNKCGGTQLP